MARRNAKQVVYRARVLLWVPETGAYIQPGEIAPLVELGRSQGVIMMHLADGNVVEEVVEAAGVTEAVDAPPEAGDAEDKEDES